MVPTESSFLTALFRILLAAVVAALQTLVSAETVVMVDRVQAVAAVAAERLAELVESVAVLSQTS
jgi:hypothetical protein